jgi:hypothetical protein
MLEVTRKGDMIVLGDDAVRIEEGHVLKTATATKELLDNSATAPHYQIGRLDALGNTITEGQEFTYVDYGGTDGEAPAEGTREFKVYKRRELTPEEQAETKGTRTYVFDLAGARKGEEAAIDLGQRIAAGGK